MADVPLILTLDNNGIPNRWISWQQACFYYAKNLVAWTLGEAAFTVYGGISRATGTWALASIASMLATILVSTTLGLRARERNDPDKGDCGRGCAANDLPSHHGPDPPSGEPAWCVGPGPSAESGPSEWAKRDSNPRHPACKAGALTN